MPRRTYYTLNSHDYFDAGGPGAHCSDPSHCTTKSHWSYLSENEFSSLQDARESAEDDDAPANRILKHEVEETVSIGETVHGYTRAQFDADQ